MGFIKKIKKSLVIGCVSDIVIAVRQTNTHMKPPKDAVLSDKPTALVMRDKKTNRIIHTIVGKNEKEIWKYIMKNDPKLDYQIIPDWDNVCEAVENYKKYI